MTSGVSKVGRPTKAEKEMRDTIADMVMAGVGLNMVESMKEMLEEAKPDFVKMIEDAEKRIMAAKNITITTPNKVKELNQLTHKSFSTLVRLLTDQMPIMLVGPAGSGKTFAASQAAEALDLEFASISVGSQTSKTDLLGYMHAGGKYVSTSFRESYEKGGVFLMDEIDAGNANVLIVLNSALAGDECAFPDGMVDKHPDFRFIATANTYGMGASRQYVGRNQIDAATLDRFWMVPWDIDETLEASMIASYEHGDRWHRVIKGVRELVEDHSYRVIVSPRATLKGVKMLSFGFGIDEVIEMCLVATAGQTERDVITNRAKELWGR